MTGAGFARGMKRIVQSRRQMTTPKKMIGSQVSSVFSRSTSPRIGTWKRSLKHRQRLLSWHGP